MTTAKQSPEHERSISCIVCEQPLPNSDKEHSYFPSGSTGYAPGYEGVRNCEDIGQLLRYMQTVTTAIWGAITNEEYAKKVKVVAPEIMRYDDENHFDEARSLCFLFSDLHTELERRFTQLDDWVTKHYKEQFGEGQS